MTGIQLLHHNALSCPDQENVTCCVLLVLLYDIILILSCLVLTVLLDEQRFQLNLLVQQQFISVNWKKRGLRHGIII